MAGYDWWAFENSCDNHAFYFQSRMFERHYSFQDIIQEIYVSPSIMSQVKIQDFFFPIGRLNKY